MLHYNTSQNPVMHETGWSYHIKIALTTTSQGDVAYPSVACQTTEVTRSLQDSATTITFI